MQQLPMKWSSAAALEIAILIVSLTKYHHCFSKNGLYIGIGILSCSFFLENDAHTIIVFQRMAYTYVLAFYLVYSFWKMTPILFKSQYVTLYELELELH